MIERRCQHCRRRFMVRAWAARHGKGRFCSVACAGRPRWTAAEDAVITARYPDTPTHEIATQLRRPLSSVYQRARSLGVEKSATYLASPHACRLRRGDNVGVPFRFKKGQVPANKGLRRPGWAPGRMRETQFKKGTRNGRAAKVYQPIGAERLSKDGYLERKISEALPFQRRWRAVHLLVWEAAHGPLPKGHAIAFINRDKTDIRLDNLECITRRELMARNTVHRWPKPLANTVQLLGALTRQIRRRTRGEEHRRSAESPVRDAGSAEGHKNADGH